MRHYLVLLCLFAGLGWSGQLRGQGTLRLWKDAPDQTQVLAATFLGGRGNDWLVSGGFAPDGTIVLAGNVAGPVFELSTAVQVIGTDLPPPPEARPIPVLVKGIPKTDKEGKTIYEKPSWRHEGVTGFLVRTSSDMQKIISAHRLPWGSGAITSTVVAQDGTILIAGRATQNIDKLGEDLVEWKLVEGVATDRKTGSCRHSFVAALTPDASKVKWIRHVQGLSDAPQLTLLADGHCRFASQDVKIIDLTGKVLKTVSIPGGPRRTASLSPTDNSLVLGGEHHWPTGREPWRCPTLNILHPDGALKYQLFDWGGPYVGLDNLRLVSDTAIRLVTHEPDGSILVMAWSDGGNSVMTQQPNDVRSPHDHKGLGITAAGAGVLSCAYIARIDPRECRFTAWTIWLAFTGVNRPNSVWVDNLVSVADNSVGIAGRSAESLMVTSNRLSDATSGSYIAVLSHDLTRVRFCSAIPGAGQVEIDEGSTQNRNGWGIISGTVQGKPRVLFVTGAVPDRDTPTVQAVQNKFGGGWTDGYAVLLDLSTKDIPVPKASPLPASEPGPTRASFEKGAAIGKRKDTALPPDGTSFSFKPNSFKYTTVDAEFRDRAGKFWPSFFWGKPVEGTFTWHKEVPRVQLIADLTNLCQPQGNQSRRVLGELVKEKDKMPGLRFVLDAIGPMKTTQIHLTERGKEVVRAVEYHDGRGTLIVGEKKIAVQPRITQGFNRTKTGTLDSVRITAWVTLPANELGLSVPGELDVRITLKGSVSPE